MRTPLRRVDFVLVMGFWTFMALLTAWNGLLDPRSRGLQPVVSSAPVVLAFLESYVWAGITLVIFSLSRRFGIERSSWIARAILLVGIGLVLAMAVEAAMAYLRFEVAPPFRRGPRRGFDPAIGITRLFWLDDFIVYLGIVAAAFARETFLRYRARQEEAARLQAQTAQLQAQLAEARLSALRTQLNPHFLFNTLHAVSTLVERDPRGVRRMIARLSELLRYTLEGAKEQEVPLREELDFLRRYLEIMQIRFEGRLDVQTDVDPGALDALVPTLILQPLVENALKHGVDPATGIGRIAIGARRDDDRVILSVRDSGPGLGGAQPSANRGVGIANTRARLAQLYGSDHSLIFRDADGSGLIAEVRLPYHTSADLRSIGLQAEV